MFLTKHVYFSLISFFACTIQKLEDSLLPARTLLSKSNDELSTDKCNTIDNNLLQTKHTSSDSLNNETLTSHKVKSKLCNQSSDTRDELDEKNLQDDAKQSLGSMELGMTTSSQKMNATINDNNSESNVGKLTRQLSEPPDMYSTHNVIHCDNSLTNNSELVRQKSEPMLAFTATTNVQTPPLKTPSCTPSVKSSETISNVESCTENACTHNLQSPIVRSRFKNVYAVHTSTPSSLLRQSLATNDYILTPITNSDKSMSPITQSATKMTKAMQVHKITFEMLYNNKKKK